MTWSGDCGVYRTNSRGTCLASARALILACTSYSDFAFRISARLDCRLLRRDRCERDVVTMVLRVEEEDDEVIESESEDEAAQCRAQCVMALSTSPEIAPSLPPNTEELELELEEEDVDDEVDATDSGRGERGGEGGRGGSPR